MLERLSDELVDLADQGVDGVPVEVLVPFVVNFNLSGRLLLLLASLLWRKRYQTCIAS